MEKRDVRIWIIEQKARFYMKTGSIIKRKPEKKKVRSQNIETLPEVSAAIILHSRDFALDCSRAYFRSKVRASSHESDAPELGFEKLKSKFVGVRKYPKIKVKHQMEEVIFLTSHHK